MEAMLASLKASIDSAAVARPFGWLFIALVVVICLDVLTRKFGFQIPGLGSTPTAGARMAPARLLFLFWLGYAYVRNVHVRIDVFTGQLSPAPPGLDRAPRHRHLFALPYLRAARSTTHRLSSSSPTCRTKAPTRRTGCPRAGSSRACLFLGLVLLLRPSCRCCCASSSACSDRRIWPRRAGAPAATQPARRGAIMEWIGDHLAVLMFLVLTVHHVRGLSGRLRAGRHRAGFGALGILFDVFRPAQFGNLMPRIWGQAVQNPVLVAVPMFIFMGTILEKSRRRRRTAAGAAGAHAPRARAASPCR